MPQKDFTMKNKTYEITEETVKTCDKVLALVLSDMRKDLKEMISSKGSNQEDVESCMSMCEKIGNAVEELERCK